MQNLKIYTSHFDPIAIYNHGWIQRYVTNLQRLHSTIRQIPFTEEYKFIHTEWEIPYQNKLQYNYYKLLYAMARYCRVKIMWRNSLNADSKVIKIIWIIGSKYRINICKAMLNCWFKCIWDYNDLHKITNDNRDYIKLMNQINEEKVIDVLEKMTVIDFAYNIRLEVYIQERYKLNYKKYRTDHLEYRHAVSKRFNHRMMLL